MRSRSVALLAALIVASCSSRVFVEKNHYGLPVVREIATYRALVRHDRDKELVELRAFTPRILLDIRYATESNFMKEKLYPVAAAYLRRPAAEALREIDEELSREGLGLKVYDAYRPYSVTERMWVPYKNPDYVADPSKGSRHNRGAAVDVTLVDLASGRELPMPTDYDAFTPKAAHAFNDLPADVLSNRRRLRDVMERHRFVALESEWWHYDYLGWERFELMDLGFGELAGAGSRDE